MNVVPPFGAPLAAVPDAPPFGPPPPPGSEVSPQLMIEALESPAANATVEIRPKREFFRMIVPIRLATGCG